MSQQLATKNISRKSVIARRFSAEAIQRRQCLCILAMARRPPASCALFANTHKHCLRWIASAEKRLAMTDFRDIFLAANCCDIIK